MTTEPGRLSSTPGAKNTNPEKETPLDPEKFKKVLKAEEPDEKQKRNRKRQEEEATYQPDPNSPENLVAGSEKKLGSPFEMKSTPPPLLPDPTSEVRPQMIPEENMDAVENPPPLEEDPTFNPPQTHSTFQMNSPSAGQKPSTPAEQKLSTVSKTPSSTSPNAPSHTTPASLHKKPPIPEKMNTPSVQDKKETKRKKEPEKIHSAPLSPQTEPKEVEKKLTAPLEAPIALPPVQSSNHPSLIGEKSPVTLLSRQPEIYQLYVNMVGIIQTVSAKSGDMNMVVTLNSAQFEKSPFYGMQIIIERFSTALNTYHIDLHVPQAALHLLNAKALADLEKAFAQLPFQVVFRTPTLLSSPRRLDDKFGPKRGRKVRSKEDKEA